MNEIIRAILQAIRIHTDWLRHILFEYHLLYYDLWSFIHLLTGALIFALLTAYGVKNRWKKLFLLLFVFEIIEAFLIIAILKLFYPEKIVDVFNDIVVGMLGGVIIYYLYERVALCKYRQYFTSFFAALFIAFIWTGTYGYRYNNPFFNSQGINWWAFLLWLISGFVIIRFFDILRRKIPVWLSLVCVWVTYFILLLFVEYIGYNVLELHELSQNGIKTPLLLNLIHGSFNLHLFYLTAPVLFLLLYNILSKIINKYEQKTHQTNA